MENILLDEWVRTHPKQVGALTPWDVLNFESYRIRVEMTMKYSWAIPNDKALQVLVRQSPLIEIGAGTGYWARLATQAGADIIAFDKAPTDKGTWNNFHGTTESWFPVKRGFTTAVKQ